MKKIAVIPARYASSRFPGKPLADILGKSMIQRVYENVVSSGLFHEVIVATDDERISKHVKEWDGRVELTSQRHKSGTERVAEIATRYHEPILFINVQGDEPFIQAGQLEALVGFMEKNQGYRIGTLAKELIRNEDILNPDIVKVVKDNRDKALYFSRQAIPYQRGIDVAEWQSHGPYFKHIGLYAYHRDTLLNIAKLPEGNLEKAESLEQLRWLENGYEIGVEITEQEAISIDRPADIDRLIKHLEASGFDERGPKKRG